MRFLRYCLLVAVLAGTHNPAWATSVKKPNIVLIVADDLGWGDLGCYPKGAAWGEEAITPTPNIDALAATGVKCMQGYTTGMVCAPSRAGLMTGQFQSRFGYFAFEDSVAPIPADLTLLPQALRDAGYRTGMVGKWHVSSASLPLDRGFESFFGFLGGQHDYYEVNIGEKMHGIGKATDAYVFDQRDPIKSMKFLTDEFTDRAIAYMSQKSEKPFFLYLAYSAPHPPMQAPWEYLSKYAERQPDGKFLPRDVARALIENMDRNVGRVREWLKANGLAENTLIVFTSDNGGSDGGPGRVLQHNGGLKGRKGMFYEGGVRVPYILNWPGVLPTGEVYKDPVSQVDLYPTFLTAAQAKDLKVQPLDGVNLIPYLTGKDDSRPHRQLYWCIEKPTTWAVRDGDWKLVLEDTDPTTLGGKFRGSPRKFKLQLYDLAADPNESNDLLDAKPEIVAKLQKVFDDYRATLKPSLATPEIVAEWKAMMAEREKTHPELNTGMHKSGSPGHWKGGDKKDKKIKTTPDAE